MSYKHTFDLVQHTPQLHFDKNRDHATLRATEVKPKLDRYLLKKLGNDGSPDWKRTTKQGDVSLDYEMRIVLNGTLCPISDFEMDAYLPGKEGRREFLYNDEIKQKGSNSFLLANMDKSLEERKYFAYCQNENLPTHHIHIFSYHPELLAMVEKHMASFLMTHNFGNRQTKGFGSYYLFPGSTGWEVPKTDWSFTVNTHSHPKGMEELFWQINLLWKAMRPGINDGVFDKSVKRYSRNTFYFKSLMFMYAKHHGIQWDKKTIKEYFFDDELKKQPYETTDDENSPLKFSADNKRLMKDLLGLSSRETWLSVYGAVIDKKHDVGENEKRRIDRFASPVTFKPIFSADGKSCQVHLILAEIPKEIYNAQFRVETRGGSFPISFPNPDVKIRGFFEYLFTKDQEEKYFFDLENHVTNTHSTNAKFKILKTIIDQIRTNHTLHNAQTPPPHA